MPTEESCARDKRPHKAFTKSPRKQNKGGLSGRSDHETSRFVRFNVWALIATIMVLSDMRNAPNAGGIINPQGARIPAARGIMTMLYPAPHQDLLALFAVTGLAELQDFHHIQRIAFYQNQPSRLNRHIGTLPMAIPMSARVSAGASLTPSPTIPTRLPSPCSSMTF